jgi:hypothetical protein
MVTKDPKALLKYWGNLCLGNQRVELLQSLARFKKLSPKQEQLVVTLSHQMNSEFSYNRNEGRDFDDWIDAPYMGDF